MLLLERVLPSPQEELRTCAADLCQPWIVAGGEVLAVVDEFPVPLGVRAVTCSELKHVHDLERCGSPVQEDGSQCLEVWTTMLALDCSKCLFRLDDVPVDQLRGPRGVVGERRFDQPAAVRTPRTVGAVAIDDHEARPRLVQ